MTTFPTWAAARAEAQRLANAEGVDFGLEHFTALGDEWVIRRLPLPGNRYGCDLTCEVVRAEAPPVRGVLAHVRRAVALADS